MVWLGVPKALKLSSAEPSASSLSLSSLEDMADCAAWAAWVACEWICSPTNRYIPLSARWWEPSKMIICARSCLVCFLFLWPASGLLIWWAKIRSNRMLNRMIDHDNPHDRDWGYLLPSCEQALDTVVKAVKAFDQSARYTDWFRRIFLSHWEWSTSNVCKNCGDVLGGGLWLCMWGREGGADVFTSSVSGKIFRRELRHTVHGNHGCHLALLCEVSCHCGASGFWCSVRKIREHVGHCSRVWQPCRRLHYREEWHLNKGLGFLKLCRLERSFINDQNSDALSPAKGIWRVKGWSSATDNEIHDPVFSFRTCFALSFSRAVF